MANISFKRGSNLNNLAITDGQFIVNTAERSIYVDVGTERLRIGDFVIVANMDALPAAGGHTTALYYVEDINCLAKWDGSRWIQINRDTGVKEVKVEGTGNAITAAAYDAETRILTLTKGATYMTAADVDGKISAKVGTIEGTVKEYVDAKTSGIASDAALTALTGRVDTLEDKVDVNLVSTAISDSVTAAKTAVLGQADYTGTVKGAYEAAAAAQATAETKTTMAEVEAKNYATKTEAQGYANAKDAAISAAKAAADAAQADVDALENKVGAVTEGKTVVEMIADAQAAATYDDTDLKNRVSTIEGDYLKAADKTELSNAIVAEKTRAEGIESGLRTDVDAIKVDYLKAVDKTELAQSIADVKSDVDTFLAAADIGGEAIDTLKEIQNYISSDGTAAAEMTSKISALETTVGDASSGLVKGVADNKAAIEAEVTRATGKEAELAQADTDNLAAAKKYADDAITALKIGDYAKQADLDTHTGNTDIHITAAERTKWNAAEGKAHTHTNKALLDTYTQTETDLADAVAKKHSHANATVLDGITAEKVSAWDSAQSNAEATAASALSAAKTELEGKISTEETRAKAAEKVNSDAIAVINGDATTDGSIAKALSDAKAYTDALANGQVTTNKNDIASLVEQLQWGSF